MDPILSSYEGTQPKGYIKAKASGYEWMVLDNEGCADAGWELTEEKAIRECRKSFNEVLEAGK